MPDDNATGKPTDASDVFVALMGVFQTAAGNRYFWFAVILGLIVLSGWASPENVTDFVERAFNAWKCTP